MRIVLRNLTINGEITIDDGTALATMLRALEFPVDASPERRATGREEPAPERDPREDFADASLGRDAFVHFVETWAEWLDVPDKDHPWAELLTTLGGADVRLYVKACTGLRSAVLGVLHLARYGVNATTPEQDIALKRDADTIAGNIGLAANYAANSPEAAAWIHASIEDVPLSGTCSLPDVYPGQIPSTPCGFVGADVDGVCMGATCSGGIWSVCASCPTKEAAYQEGVAAAHNNAKITHVKDMIENTYSPKVAGYSLFAKGYNTTIATYMKEAPDNG